MVFSQKHLIRFLDRKLSLAELDLADHQLFWFKYEGPNVTDRRRIEASEALIASFPVAALIHMTVWREWRVKT